MRSSYRILDFVIILLRANIQPMLTFLTKLAQVMARCRSPYVRRCDGNNTSPRPFATVETRLSFLFFFPAKHEIAQKKGDGIAILGVPRHGFILAVHNHIEGIHSTGLPILAYDKCVAAERLPSGAIVSALQLRHGTISIW